MSFFFNAVSGGGGGAIEYVGGLTRYVTNVSDVTAGNPLDVLSIASVGDLVIIACAADNTSTSGDITWGGMTLTTVNPGGFNQYASASPVATYHYAIVTGSDANPYVLTPTGTGIRNAAFGVAVFSGGITTLEGSSYVGSAGGMPNPPALTANGELWVAVGYLDDDPVSATAQSGYMLAVSGSGQTSPGLAASIMISYKIQSLASDDPDAFGGSGDAGWKGITTAFSTV